MQQELGYSEFQIEFEEFCKNKFLKFSKITDYVYKFPENSFNQLQGEFFLDFSQFHLELKAKLKGLIYIDLPVSALDKFRKTPKYYKSGIFVYNLESNSIFDLFEETYEDLEILSADLDKLQVPARALTLFSLASHPSSSSTLHINKLKYKETYNTDPLIWFGDYFLIISNDLATNQLFIECFIELKNKNLLNKLHKKTQFNSNVELTEVLEHFGIKFHDKFLVKYQLYKCLFEKKSSWIDFYLERTSSGTWRVSCPEISSFILPSSPNPIEFLEDCRGNIQFKLPSNDSL